MKIDSPAFSSERICVVIVVKAESSHVLANREIPCMDVSVLGNQLQ